MPKVAAKSQREDDPLPEDREKNRTNYNRLVRQARLLSLLLDKVIFKIAPEAIGADTTLWSRELIGRRDILSHGDIDDTCIATIAWTVNMKFKRKSVVKCQASYIISYGGMQGFQRENIEMFSEVVAKAATYTYFRALYAHLDWSANLGSSPLPVMQFQARV